MKKYLLKMFLFAAALVMGTNVANAADPDLSKHTLKKSIDWVKMSGGQNVDLTISSTALDFKTWETGNQIYQSIYDMTAPEDLSGTLAFQAVHGSKGWWVRAGGLYCYAANRSGAVYGLSKGDVVVFTSSGDIANAMTLTNADGNPDGAFTFVKSEDGHTYYCTATADEAYVGFCGAKNGAYITKTEIYSAPADQKYADYTVNYLIEGTTTKIKDSETLNGQVGATPSVTTNPITYEGKKYLFRSSDLEGKTIASNGSTVVNLYYSEAKVFKAVLTNNLNSKTIEATGFEGDNIDVAYPTYQLVDGTLYSAGKLSGDKKGYYMTINLSQDGVTKNVEYTATTITGVTALIEVEKVQGAAICGNGNTKVRSSFGGSGYATGEDLKLLTITPAKYIMKAVVCDASKTPAAVFNFKVADQVVFSTTPGSVNWAESTSEEFEVNQVSVLKLAAGTGSTNIGVDFIYLQKTGEAENVIEAPHFKLTSPEEGVYDIMDVEITNTVNQALTEFNIAFPEGNIITASESVKAQMKDANGNVLYEGVASASTEKDNEHLGAIKMDGHITKAGTYTLVAPAGLFTINGETLSDEQTFSFVIEGELPLGYYDNVAVIKNNMDYTVYTDPANESEVFMKYTAKYDGKVTITFDNFQGDMFAAAAEKNFYYDNKETAKLVPTETRSGMDYVYSEFEVEANKTYYIELMPTGSNGPIKFHVNFKLAAFDEIEDGPYFDVDSLLLEAKVRLMELDEMYNDETREKLGLTEAWSRINDLIAREEIMIAADKENHPNPSLARLAGHYSRILNIEAAMSSFVVAAENVHPIDLFELYKEVIANINYTQDAIKNLIGDEPLIESLATLWNELLSRINKADDDIKALQAKPNPTDDEIAALDEELNTLANDLEEFLALLNGEATGINAATATQNENAAVYNMAGQKVNTQFKGIVIKNGKKVIIK